MNYLLPAAQTGQVLNCQKADEKRALCAEINALRSLCFCLFSFSISEHYLFFLIEVPRRLFDRRGLS